MNFMKHRRKVTNPLLKKLSLEQGILLTEVKELNNELLIISKLLKDKENELQTINSTLINKTLRGPFLSVVDSSLSSMNISKRQNRKIMNKSDLICFNGGRNS